MNEDEHDNDLIDLIEYDVSSSIHSIFQFSMFDIFIDIFLLKKEGKKIKNAWGCANNVENQKPHSNRFICFADFYLMCAVRRKTKSWIETCLHISRLDLLVYEAYISNIFFLYAYKVRAYRLYQLICESKNKKCLMVWWTYKQNL